MVVVAVVTSLILLAACHDTGRRPADDDSPPAPVAAAPLPDATGAPAPAGETRVAVASPPRPLGLGDSVATELAAGRTDAYLLALESGAFMRVSIDQPEVDVAARLFDPSGRLLITYDLWTGTARPEQVLWVAGETGNYRLEVSAVGSRTEGAYTVSFEVLRPATERDQKRHQAELMLAEGDALRGAADEGARRRAEASYRAAVELLREIDHRQRQADGLYRLARVQSSRDWRQAMATFETAAGLLDADADAWQLGDVLQRMADLLSRQGELRRAVDLYEQAVPLRQRAGSLRGEFWARNNLGQAYKLLGDISKALTHYRRALECAEQLQDRERQARALHNQGKALLATGMVPQALDSLQLAIEIREQLGGARELALTLNAMGQAQFRAGEPQAALASHLRALAFSREAEDRGLEALALTDIALVYQELGRLEAALKRLEQALETYTDLGRRHHQATVLHHMGWVLDAMDRDAQALARYRQALEATDHRPRRIKTLYGMAVALRQRGELELAREHLETALAEVERLRAKPLSPTLRYSYFATKQSYYETYVELLMELHRRRPAAGFDAQALTASERARARSQLDALTESGIDLNRGAPKDVLEHDQTLEKDIASLELQRHGLLEDGAGPRRLAAVERRLRSLFLEHDRVQAKIRDASPQYAALTQPRPLEAAEIRRRVVDASTLLLEYDLGKERSYLWAVTPDEVRSFELPPREEIETTAERAYKLLSSKHLTLSKVQTELTLERLSDRLLGPVAGLLGSKRLLIVADGALQYIPFGVLPEPLVDGPQAAITARRPPLIARHEIVSMPSASTLAVLREQVGRRRRPEGTVAVFADPVFALEDPRFSEEEPDTPLSGARGPATPEARNYDRLIYSRREAEDILALAPADSAFVAVDFAADRDTVMSGILADYRFLHFATHGVLNTEHPQLSRLVLSKFDRQGRERDSFVFAHEIYNLELAADLVVLSACETALGAEIRGEGLLGLTQGFMYAGAASVLVSLWNVDDQATAALMARFYRKLLVENLRPAAALGAAQNEIREEDKWRAPYFWAGFVVQGDWR